MVFVENENEEYPAERLSTVSTRARSLDSSYITDGCAQGGGLKRRLTCSDEKSIGRNNVSGSNNKRGSKNMVPLTTVEINAFSPNHPLSALRSCSEFRKDTCSQTSQEVLNYFYTKMNLFSISIVDSDLISLRMDRFLSFLTEERN